MWTTCVRMGCAMALVAIAETAMAGVLCQKKSGAVAVRDVCKKKETVLDPAQAGLQARVTGTCSGAAMSSIGGDGSATCQAAGVFAFGQIRSDGSIRAASPNVVDVAHPSAGRYCVTFSNAPANPDQLEGAVASLGGDENSGIGFVRVSNGQVNGWLCDGLAIVVSDGTGTRIDGRFTFVVP